jgi:hypothetical protein
LGNREIAVYFRVGPETRQTCAREILLDALVRLWLFSRVCRLAIFLCFAIVRSYLASQEESYAASTIREI